MPTVLDRVKAASFRIADPQEGKSRRVFAFGAVVLVTGAAIFALRVLALTPDGPGPTSAARASVLDVCDNLIASCVVTALATFLLGVLLRSGVENEDVDVVAPYHIRPMLLDLLPSASEYWFKGRSGRYFRDRVLPAMAEASRRNASTRRVHVLMPDPGNEAMLESYATYRNSLRREEGGRWTARRIQTEILATIISVAEQASRNGFLAAEVAVAQDYGLLRIDMSDERMVMTREDPQWPAFTCSRRSRLYTSYQEEIRLGMSLGRKINVGQYPRDVELDATNVGTVATAMGLDPIEDNVASEVFAAIRRPSDPYA